MIKAIIFDFYGVISSDDLWDFLGVDKQSQTVFHELADAVNLGELEWDEYCTRVGEESGRKTEEVREMYANYAVNEELIAYIEELKQSYRIGLLTNASHGHVDGILGGLNTAELFESVTVSADLAVIKPDPKIYQAALSDMGLDPSETVFIDDAQRNVEGAKAVGMSAIWYQSNEQLRADLEALLSSEESA